MLTAFAVEGFERLRHHMETRRDASPDPASRSLSVGEAYLEFALRNPQHFRVMFRTELLDPEDPAYQEACRAAFHVLEQAIRGCEAASGSVNEATLAERCLLAWSTVHGYATLCLEGAIGIPGRGSKTRITKGIELGSSLLRLLGPALFPGQTRT
jgi:hypothetical protein